MYRETFYIADWLVEPALNRISGPHSVHKVGMRAMRVLVCLAQEAGDVVTREHLFETVWHGTVVSEDSLTNVVSDLRKIFGDAPRNPRVIETVRAIGYRLIAPVHSTPLPSRTASRPHNPAGVPSLVKGYASRNRRVAWGLFAVAMVLGSAMGSYLALTNLSRSPVSYGNPVPLTSYPGLEYQPALSPDGQQLAFVWINDRDKQPHIYVKRVGTETPLRVTSGPGFHNSPVWSPDGHALAFVRTQHAGNKRLCGLYYVSFPGGDERKVADCHSMSRASLDWSPDGSLIAFADRVAPDQPFRIYLVATATLDVWPVTNPQPPFNADLTPRFSPDGRTLAFVRGTLDAAFAYNRATIQGDIFLVSVQQDGQKKSAWRDVTRLFETPSAFAGALPTSIEQPRQLTDDHWPLHGLDWGPDGRSLIYASNTLWRVDLKDGSRHEIFRDPRAFSHFPVLAGEPAQLVFEQWRGDFDIWRTRLGDTSSHEAADHLFLHSTSWDVNPVYSPDGSRIAFASSRSGAAEIWISDASGQHPTRLTFLNADYTLAPSWSPDGTQIVFTSRIDDNTDVYRIGAHGGQPHRLTQDPAPDGTPSWSHDSRWIYFGSERTGTWQIWKIPASGGPAIQITVQGGFSAMESSAFPHKPVLYYTRLDTVGIWEVPAIGGNEVLVLPFLGRADRHNWTLTDEALYFVAREGEGPVHLSQYNLATRQVEPVKRLQGTLWSSMSSISLSPDRAWLLYATMENRSSDLKQITLLF